MIKKFNKNQMQSFILSMILILTFTFNIVIVKAQNNGNELYSEVTIELQHKIINENKNLPIEERYASLNIDKEKLTGIDTDSLLNLVLEYPLLGNIFAYDNTKLGTHVLAQKFNPINELILRKDAIHFIEQRIGSSKIENDYIKTSFLNALTEYILSSKVISDTDISMATQTTVKTPQGTSVTVIIWRRTNY